VSRCHGTIVPSLPGRLATLVWAGNAIELEGRTSDVARRQADGSWLIVIDDPYATEHGFD